MSPTRTDFDEREDLILDAAVDALVRFGYQKTTMSDIAEQAGVTRAIVYLHFENKERLFEALLLRETQKYLDDWLAEIAADPQGGTLASVFRSALAAVRRSPLLLALMRGDGRVLGRAVTRPGSPFTPLQSLAVWPETLRALQAVGAVRAEIQPEVFGTIMNALALGLLTLQDDPRAAGSPPLEQVLESVAELLDRTLTPVDGGNREAGRQLLLGMAEQTRQQLALAKAGKRPAHQRA